MNRLGEVVSLTTYDGEELHLAGQYTLWGPGNLGAPPVTYDTRRAYGQHGSSVANYRLNERVLSMRLRRDPALTRSEYWSNRLAIHNILRPNRGVPLTLTLHTADGNQRALLVRPDPGLELPQNDANDGAIDDTLQFIAHDPIWFDPDVISIPPTTEAIGLVFPLVFPIVFGSLGLSLSTSTITYNGTWRTYPTLTMTGPFSKTTLYCKGTKATIVLLANVTAGQQRIITLASGALSVVDQTG